MQLKYHTLTPHLYQFSCLKVLHGVSVKSTASSVFGAALYCKSSVGL